MKFPKSVVVFGDTAWRGECPTETEDQITVVNHIRKRWPTSIGKLVVHVRNESKRTHRQAVYHKAQGMTKGASDLFIPGSPSLSLELKRKDHTKSKWADGQVEYLEAAQDVGGFSCVALGWEAAIAAVEYWLTLQKNSDE